MLIAMYLRGSQTGNRDNGWELRTVTLAGGSFGGFTLMVMEMMHLLGAQEGR